MGRTVPTFFLQGILRLGGAVTMPRFGVEGCFLFFGSEAAGFGGKQDFAGSRLLSTLSRGSHG